MRTPACIGILIFVRLHVCVRPHDFLGLKPPTFLDSRHPLKRMGADVCLINNTPFFCPKAAPETTYILPHIINGEDVSKHHLFATAHNPLLIPPTSLTMSLEGRLDIPRRLSLYDLPQKYTQASLLNPSYAQIHGSSLHNAVPLLFDKYNYKVTVEDTIKPSLDDSMVPSGHDAIDASESTTETLVVTISKPDENKKTLVNVSLYSKLTRSLDLFERKFYQTTFKKLLSRSPLSRVENGISFTQSGLFLYLTLLALSTEVDSMSSDEIHSNLRIQASASEKVEILKQIVSWLPTSSQDLKFRWATRLVLEPGLLVSQEFMKTAAALQLHLEWLNGTETLDNIISTLNNRVKTDSGGAMRNTFEEDDFLEGACSILLNTMYIRARWRSPPTVLNGSRPFRDTEHSPQRSVRMIKINDVMRYAVLREWRAEALEIRYATPNLTLLLLVPQGHSLKGLAENMGTTSLRKIDSKMRTMRVAAILPIYTLRMTLLLPGKLKAMGISRLVDRNNSKSGGCGELRLSHAVQRLMFWAEAGRNAFKDDGIEWDEAPEKEVMVDRPYLFYVRWKNVTLMNGNFVL